MPAVKSNFRLAQCHIRNTLTEIWQCTSRTAELRDTAAIFAVAVLWGGISSIPSGGHSVGAGAIPSTPNHRARGTLGACLALCTKVPKRFAKPVARRTVCSRHPFLTSILRVKPLASLTCFFSKAPTSCGSPLGQDHRGETCPMLPATPDRRHAHVEAGHEID